MIFIRIEKTMAQETDLIVVSRMEIICLHEDDKTDPHIMIITQIAL
jgi:hypothetical protein